MVWALPKQPINQFKLVQESRQEVLRAYCSNVYTVQIVLAGSVGQKRKRTQLHVITMPICFVAQPEIKSN